MNVNSIFANNTATAHHSTASQFQQVIGASSAANPVFRPDSVSFGSVASPFRTYTSTIGQRNSIGTLAPQFQIQGSAVNSAANWCISNYYSLSPEEIQPALNGVLQEIGNADFSGKTGLEIYEWIENKFVETFGENFMMAHDLLGFVPVNDISVASKGNWIFTTIGSAFVSALNWQLGDTHDDRNAAIEINRTRLFGNMSNSEIKDNIRAKYPEKLTNRCFALMTAEMRSVGLDSGIMGIYIANLILGPGAFDNPENLPPCDELVNRWVKLLDSPLDSRSLTAAHNELMRVQYNMPDSKFMEMKDFLAGLIGDDLEDLFLRELDRHNSEITRLREMFDNEYDRERIKGIYENGSFSASQKKTEKVTAE
jgi:hypothetical protein